jgi:hypothetical protein
MKQFLFVTLTAFSTHLFAQGKIPVGTILPVQLNSSLRSDKVRVGEQVSARVMQDVRLPAGRKIHSGTKVIGHVVSVRSADDGIAGEMSLRFDALEIGKQCIAMILRCMRSLRFEPESYARRSHQSGWSDHAALKQGQRESTSGQRLALARECNHAISLERSEHLSCAWCVFSERKGIGRA